MSEVLGKYGLCRAEVRKDESDFYENCNCFYHTECVKYKINGVDAKVNCMVCGYDLGYATNTETEDDLRRLA